MSRYSRRRKYCRFTAEKIEEIHYKDLNLLKAFVTETARLYRAVSRGPRRTTSASWRRRSNGLVISHCCLIPIDTRSIVGEY